MTIPELEQRIKKAEEVLQHVANGNFDQRIRQDHNDDAFTFLEMGINFMILDLRKMAEENEASRRRLLEQQRQLEDKLATIEEQALAIRELSTPVMQIWDGILLLPIVGVIDTKRSREVMDNLLESIVQTQSRAVILDITGVEVVDTRTADYLLKVVRAATLLGSHCVLTGLNPAVAQTLVDIGADLTEVRTLRDLQAGLQFCLRQLQQARGTPTTAA